MTGPNEAKLDQTHDRRSQESRHGCTRTRWAETAPSGLRAVAQRLESAKSRAPRRLGGTACRRRRRPPSMCLAETVRDARRSRWTTPAEAVRIAMDALIADAPGRPSSRSYRRSRRSSPGPTATISEDAKKAHVDDIAAHKADARRAREEGGPDSPAPSTPSWRTLAELLSGAAPYDLRPRKVDDTKTGGPTSATERPTTGGHVNSGSASGSAAVIGGNVGGTSATADGELIGTVGAGVVGVGAGGRRQGLPAEATPAAAARSVGSPAQPASSAAPSAGCATSSAARPLPSQARPGAGLSRWRQRRTRRQPRARRTERPARSRCAYGRLARQLRDGPRGRLHRPGGQRHHRRTRHRRRRWRPRRTRSRRRIRPA